MLAQGTSDEVALLVAEFALLDGPISAFAEVVEKGEAGRINEEELARLAVEIPDLAHAPGHWVSSPLGRR